MDFCEALYKIKINNSSNQSSMDRAAIAVIDARRKSPDFKYLTDPYMKKMFNELVSKYLPGINILSRHRESNQCETAIVRLKFSEGNWSPESGLSPKMIEEFLASYPSKKEWMNFCEIIYKAKVDNRYNKSPWESFVFAVINRRSRDNAFKLSTDPCFEEKFDQEMYATMDSFMGKDCYDKKEIQNFIASCPSKAELMKIL